MPATRSLNYKERQFVYFYTNECAGNPVQAAVRAGYRDPEAAARRLIGRARVRAAIGQRATECCMPPEELLARVDEQASFDITLLHGCFKREEEIHEGPLVWGTHEGERVRTRTVTRTLRQYLDFDELRKRGLGRFVKKMRVHPDGRIDLEFHDAQNAQALLLKCYGLLSERTGLQEFDPSKLTIEQLREIAGQDGPRRGLPAP